MSTYYILISVIPRKGYNAKKRHTTGNPSTKPQRPAPKTLIVCGSNGQSHDIRPPLTRLSCPNKTRHTPLISSFPTRPPTPPQLSEYHVYGQKALRTKAPDNQKMTLVIFKSTPCPRELCPCCRLQKNQNPARITPQRHPTDKCETRC